MESDIKDGLTEARDVQRKTELGEVKRVVPEELTNMSPDEVIAFSADMNVVMEVLQNQMYKNKSIWEQEIICNGRDAVRRRISLQPDSFVPRIEITVDQTNQVTTIKDNGTGMDMDIIKNVYRYYGRSDKRKTLNETGMFGLGAKSPFVIVDTFMVKTCHMTERIMRHLAITKQGISIMAEYPCSSDDDIGTSVIINSMLNTPGLDDKFSMTDIPIILQINAGQRHVQTRRIECNDDIIKKKLERDSKIIVSRKGYTLYVTGTASYRPEFKVYWDRLPYKVIIDDDVRNQLRDIKFSGTIIVNDPMIIKPTATREDIARDDQFFKFFSMVLKDTKEEIGIRMKKHEDNFDINNPIPELELCSIAGYKFKMPISDMRVVYVNAISFLSRRKTVDRHTADLSDTLMVPKIYIDQDAIRTKPNKKMVLYWIKEVLGLYKTEEIDLNSSNMYRYSRDNNPILIMTPGVPNLKSIHSLTVPDDWMTPEIEREKRTYVRVDELDKEPLLVYLNGHEFDVSNSIAKEIVTRVVLNLKYIPLLSNPDTDENYARRISRLFGDSVIIPTHFKKTNNNRYKKRGFTLVDDDAKFIEMVKNIKPKGFDITLDQADKIYSCMDNGVEGIIESVGVDKLIDKNCVVIYEYYAYNLVSMILKDKCKYNMPSIRIDFSGSCTLSDLSTFKTCRYTSNVDMSSIKLSKVE